MFEGGGDDLDNLNFTRQSVAIPRYSNSSVTKRQKKLNYSFSSQESCVNPEPLFDVKVGKNRSNFMKIKKIIVIDEKWDQKVEVQNSHFYKLQYKFNHSNEDPTEKEKYLKNIDTKPFTYYDDFGSTERSEVTATPHTTSGTTTPYGTKRLSNYGIPIFDEDECQQAVRVKGFELKNTESQKQNNGRYNVRPGPVERTKNENCSCSISYFFRVLTAS